MREKREKAYLITTPGGMFTVWATCKTKAMVGMRKHFFENYSVPWAQRKILSVCEKFPETKGTR